MGQKQGDRKEIAVRAEGCFIAAEGECMLNEGRRGTGRFRRASAREELNCAFGSLRASSNELNDGTITSFIALTNSDRMLDRPQLGGVTVPSLDRASGA